MKAQLQQHQLTAKEGEDERCYYQRTHTWEDNDSEIETDRDTGSP
jgi:hypothetical protein